MDETAKPKPGWETWGRRENWWGPYATKGAAIDAGLSAGAQVRECQACGAQ